jgi:molybdate transport system substrate-binding protein
MDLPKLLPALFLLICFCSPGMADSGQTTSNPKVIRVSAGVGLKDALYAIQKAYSRLEPGVGLEFNFAASGFLRKQIEQGAPVDLFLAPGRQHLQALLDGGFTDEQNSCALLGNDLAMIVAREKAGSIKNFSDLVDEVKTLAVGQPDFVPVGKYARETLTHLGLWNELKDRVVYGKSVRQVLVYVDSGNADAGLVFSSDTKLLTSGSVVALAPAESHSPIVFSMAGIRGSKHPAELKAFMAFLKGPKAAAIFTDFGFRPLNPGYS